MRNVLVEAEPVAPVSGHVEAVCNPVLADVDDSALPGRELEGDPPASVDADETSDARLELGNPELLTELPGESDDPADVDNEPVVEAAPLTVPVIGEVENIADVVGRSDGPTGLLECPPFGVDDEEPEADEGGSNGSVP